MRDGAALARPRRWPPGFQSIGTTGPSTSPAGAKIRGRRSAVPNVRPPTSRVERRRPRTTGASYASAATVQPAVAQLLLHERGGPVVADAADRAVLGRSPRWLQRAPRGSTAARSSVIAAATARASGGRAVGDRGSAARRTRRPAGATTAPSTTPRTRPAAGLLPVDGGIAPACERSSRHPTLRRPAGVQCRPGRTATAARSRHADQTRVRVSVSRVDGRSIPATLRPLVAPAASRAGAAGHHGLVQRPGSPPRRRRRDARWPPRERAARRARARRRSRIPPVHSPLPSWPSGPYWRLPAGAWRTSDGALGATNERNTRALAGRPAGAFA